MVLSLDLPAPPLFQDEMEANIIPQVPLNTLLAKYNGISESVSEQPYPVLHACILMRAVPRSTRRTRTRT